MPPKKKKQQSKHHERKDKRKDKGKSESLAKICLVIAFFDLFHALYFTLSAIIALVTKFSVFALLALAGVIFWVVCVITLLVGLVKRRPSLVRFWLRFSIVGFVADILFLLWGIATSLTVDWDRLMEFTVVFIGIFIEIACISVVNRYYKVMSPGKRVCCGKKSDKKKKSKKKPRKK